MFFVILVLETIRHLLYRSSGAIGNFEMCCNTSESIVMVCTCIGEHLACLCATVNNSISRQYSKYSCI